MDAIAGTKLVGLRSQSSHSISAKISGVISNSVVNNMYGTRCNRFSSIYLIHVVIFSVVVLHLSTMCLKVANE